jgi:hypothetical protein
VFSGHKTIASSVGKINAFRLKKCKKTGPEMNPGPELTFN